MKLTAVKYADTSTRVLVLGTFNPRNEVGVYVRYSWCLTQP